MKISQAIVSLAAAVATGVTGGVLYAGAEHQAATGDPKVTPATAEASPSAPASKAPSETPKESPSAPAKDELGAANVIDKAFYRKQSGHSFTALAEPKGTDIAPCLETTTRFYDQVEDGTPRILAHLAHKDERFVSQEAVQLKSSKEAMRLRAQVVNLASGCQVNGYAGDHGYGEPVALGSDGDADSDATYFPLYSSDQEWGGFFIIRVGSRVSVIDIEDTFSHQDLGAFAVAAQYRLGA